MGDIITWAYRTVFALLLVLTLIQVLAPPSLLPASYCIPRTKCLSAKFA